MKQIFTTIGLLIFCINIISQDTQKQVPASLIIPEKTEYRIFVPGEQLKIQNAVNIAKNGDTIIVAPGTYYENINLMGKKITIASYYIFDSSLYYILNTIINAGKPLNADTSSCFIAISKEDTTTIIQGFTLTGGGGTKLLWPVDNSFYRQGGAIAIMGSALTIKNNLFINNSAKNLIGVVSSGGGAISIEYHSYAKIYNNTFVNNYGYSYGGAIELCESGADIRNNIFASNKGGVLMGGGAILISGSDAKPVKIINNTFVGNEAIPNANSGGGIGGAISCINATTSKNVLWNNIIWGNTQQLGEQVYIFSSTDFDIKYNNIENWVEDKWNISRYPLWMNDQLYLSDISPCIDKGIDSSVFNDRLSGTIDNTPFFPAQGSLRNDIGAYGGPYVVPLAGIEYQETIIKRKNKIISVYTGDSVAVYLEILNQGYKDLTISSIEIGAKFLNYLTTDTILPVKIAPYSKGFIKLKFKPASAGTFQDSVRIFHDNNYTGGKTSIFIGASGKASVLLFNTEEYPNSFDVSPNPCVSYINVTTNVNCPATLELISINGLIMKTVYIRNQNSSVVDISALKPGMYFCVLSTANEKLIRKIVKN